MARPRTAFDYQDGITAASRSGLAEVVTTLGAYRDAMVLIGGWAPYLILESAPAAEGLESSASDEQFVHVGSIDIDFVVDPDVVDEEKYATIVAMLSDRGYVSGADPLCQFQRTMRSPVDGLEYMIRVDFLTPRPLPGMGRSRRHRTVHKDLRARTLEGAEVALGHWFWYELESRLPDGARTRAKLKVADLVGTLALKGIAIGTRYVEKDAYDIYSLCAHFPGGAAAVAEAVRPYLEEQPVRRGITAIAEKFRDQDAEGPTWVAAFTGETETDAQERARVDAFMRVHEVCHALGLVP